MWLSQPRNLMNSPFGSPTGVERHKHSPHNEGSFGRKIVAPPSTPAPPTIERRRGYVPVPLKYAIAMAFAICWLLFSIWASRPWMEDLGAVTHPLFAITCLTFIAYAPGFMNAFMIVSLL